MPIINTGFGCIIPSKLVAIKTFKNWATQVNYCRSLVLIIKMGKPEQRVVSSDTFGLQCLCPGIQAQNLPEFGGGASQAADSQPGLERWGQGQVNMCPGPRKESGLG